MGRRRQLTESARRALAHLTERLMSDWEGSVRIEIRRGGVRDLVELDERAQARPLKTERKKAG